MMATIAVVDDDATYIRFMERALSSLGYGCMPITTFDIDDTAAIVEAIPLEAVIIDVYMYDRAAGFACIDAIRKGARGKDMPLVVASGAHGKLASQTAFLSDVGCVPLLKPFGLDDLTHALHMARGLVEARSRGAPMRIPETMTQVHPGLSA
jgi:DNA-binding NtrC family response regulator